MRACDERPLWQGDRGGQDQSDASARRVFFAPPVTSEKFHCSPTSMAGGARSAATAVRPRRAGLGWGGRLMGPEMKNRGSQEEGEREGRELYFLLDPHSRVLLLLSFFARRRSGERIRNSILDGLRRRRDEMWAITKGLTQPPSPWQLELLSWFPSPFSPPPPLSPISKFH